MADAKKGAGASAPAPSPTPAAKPLQPAACWQADRVVDFTAPKGGVEAGRFYRIGDVVAFAKASAPEGRRFQAVTAGLFVSAPKAEGEWAEGDALGFDAESGIFTKGRDGAVGYAELIAESSDEFGRVRLIGALA